MSGRKLLFLATEDWFVRSHFLPPLRRARAEGYEVAVAARLSGALDSEDVRWIDTPFARGSLNPLRLAQQVSGLRELIARERPDIIHAIALRPILLMLLAGVAVPQVYHLTGRGYLAVGRAPWVGAMNALFRTLARRALAKPGRVLLVENESDRKWIEGDRPLPAERVVVSPGAGVDVERFAPAPPPATPPVVVGVVSRLIWSKGIDLAVAAIKQLRNKGVAIELRIAGAADADNPERVGAEEIAAWSATDGVSVLGRVSDTNAFWAGCHLACLPSRGGEGLPRSLLEAAACGRAIVTTDVPGCADFARQGEVGALVAADDAAALAAALETLAADEAKRQRMGEAGRALVVGGFTEQQAADAAARAWRAALGAPPVSLAARTETAAGIVAFRPNADVLLPLIRRLVSEADTVFVFVNGTGQAPVFESVRTLGALVIESRHNVGVGEGFNQLASHATAAGYTRLAIFDDDSGLPEGGIATLERSMDALREAGRKPAVIGPKIVGPANADATYRAPRYFSVGDDRIEDARAVWYVISSGSLIDLEAYSRVGPFRGDFFIDAIDTEWCFRAWAGGYSCWADEGVAMEHRIGQGVVKNVGRAIPRQAVFRLYAYVRNQSYCLTLAHVPLAWKARIFAHVARVTLVSWIDQKFSLSFLGAMVQAAWRGLRGKLGPPPGAELTA